MEDYKRDSHEARCNGLRNRKACLIENHKYVFADNVEKQDGPFYCPECYSEAIVRKCIEKDDHFAHKAKLSPVATSKDQKLHNLCRDSICSYLKEKFPDGKWEIERPIKANETKGTKERIPDISGRIGITPIAIEVQKTAYTINRIAEKTEDYNKLGISVLWVVPLYEELGEAAFRPRLYEKYLHCMYYGRIYYWTPLNTKMLIPIHYSPTKRYIEVSSFFDVDLKEEVSFGGYYQTYKTLKTPDFGELLDISTMFKSHYRNSFIPREEKKAIPNCILYMDKLERWWPKDEHRDIDNQKEIFRKPFNQDVISTDYYDDYDNYDEI